MTPSPPSTTLRNPDAILAELWEVKRQINAEAGYRLEELARMARESAEKIRRQWDLDRAKTDVDANAKQLRGSAPDLDIEQI